MKETPAVETVMETVDENEGGNAPEGENDKTPAGEETNLSSSDDKEASREMPELPKVTQEMVNALLVECRTRTANHPNNNTATSSCGEKGETQTETQQGEKAGAETKEPVKNHAEEEMRKQEREKKARKEKEMRERERKEKERRAWEKMERAKREREWEERARKERERREEERREWERRERERRERKRGYGEGMSGSRSTCRSEGYRQSSWKNSTEAETKLVEEEEEEEEFPFNMSDFVTVDEVGDVTDLPSPSPDVPMETTEGGEDAPTSVQQDPPEHTPLEVATETPTPDETVTPAAQSPVLPAVASTPAASQSDSLPCETHEPASHAEAPEPEIAPVAAPDSTSEVEKHSPPAPSSASNPPEAAPSDTSSNNTVTGEVTSEGGEHKTVDGALNHSQAKEETVVVQETQDQEPKETREPAAGKEDESAKRELQKKSPMNSDTSLPPFDPKNPVGMEFLVPKTGFFCKVCNRFFSGAKEAEINHCKTIKHYENLQKYLQSTGTVNETTKSTEINGWREDSEGILDVCFIFLPADRNHLFSLQIRESGGGVEDPNSNTHQHLHPTLCQPQRPGEMPEGVFAEMMSRFQRLSSSEAILTTLPHTSDPQSRNPSQVNAQLSLRSQSSEHADPPPPYSPPRSSSESSLNLPLCPIHLRGLELFCRTDNTCVCRSCVETTIHRGHNITPAKREWQIRKSQLGIAEVELKDLISERERKVEEIHSSLREIQMIEMSHQAAAHRAQSLLKDLEEEMAVLKKRSAALSQLAVSEDYVLFLKMFPAVSTSPPMKEWSGVSVSSELTSGVILRAVNSMTECLQEEMRKLSEICQRPSLDQSVPRPNPKTRRVQEYAADITLDHNTAHPRLIISADAKQVHCGDRHQLLPDNPERFDRVVCVLGHQGFNSGRHYWEVQVGGKTDWDLGVACRSVNRKGKITVSPAHGYWFLSLRDRNDYAFRTEPSTSLTVNLRPSRIGVYVDCDKGAVSFYNVEARVLIYTFTDWTGQAHTAQRARPQ
ncbi:hypothetical protein INR49_002054 [Caranx melampygus]|nr:hypothetical protein INR49_002054 [Caranx melampygus]